MNTSIAAIRNALSNPQYYDLPINEAVLAGSSDTAIEAILSHCIEKAEGVVIPLRKLYGIEVEVEEEIDVSDVQVKAAESLKRLTMAIAEKENMSVNNVDKIVKKYIDSGLSLSELPVSWMGYHLQLSSAIVRIINGEKNKKAVMRLLSNRVDESVDWSGIGDNLVKAINIKFIGMEQSAWEKDESDGTMGELSMQKQIQSLMEKVEELTSIVSSLTSANGESESTTVTVNSKRLQPV